LRECAYRASSLRGTIASKSSSCFSSGCGAVVDASAGEALFGGSFGDVRGVLRERELDYRQD